MSRRLPGLTALLALTACAVTPDREDGGPPAPAAVLPPEDGALAPSPLRVDPALAARLGDVEACATCHREEADRWSQGAHAHASFDNPWYRLSVDALRQDEGFEASRPCAGCHDPVLLASGAMDRPVDPATPEARAGVTCLMCHGAAEAGAQGNAHLVLPDDAALVPPDRSEGAVADHVALMRRGGEGVSTAVCGACHRGFVGEATGTAHHLVGMDELGTWAASPHAGPASRAPDWTAASPRACKTCHGSRVETSGSVPVLDFDHAVPAAHGAIGAGTGLTEDIGRALRDTVRLTLGGLREPSTLTHLDGVPEDPQGPLWLEVVLRNVGVGHAFPAGPRDLQDTRLTVTLTRGDRAWTSDDHVLRAEVVDAEGQPVQTHDIPRLYAKAWDHTIPSGDARAVRFAVPREALSPDTRVTARLTHRRFPDAFAQAACAVARPDDVADPCAAEPVHLVAEAHGGLTADREPQAVFDHALALSHDTQERLDTAWRRAQVLGDAARWAGPREALQARVRALQGRREDALAAADRAEALLDDPAAVLIARVLAHQRVWDWPATAEAAARWAAHAPTDTSAWRTLATSSLAAGRPDDALAAAQRGLTAAPRDPELLRVQHLALTALGHPSAEAEAAWLAHRPSDDVAEAGRTCARGVEGCATAREPVPVYTLRAQAPAVR